MNQKQKIINIFQLKIKEELDKIDEIDNKKNKEEALDTLYKINQYFAHFEELEPTLNRYFEIVRRKKKWEER